MLKIIDFTKVGAKHRIFISIFCIGVRTDQITPEYFTNKAEYILDSKVASNKTFFARNKGSFEGAKSFSKQKSNYGRRAKNQSI